MKYAFTEPDFYIDALYIANPQKLFITLWITLPGKLYIYFFTVSDERHESIR